MSNRRLPRQLPIATAGICLLATVAACSSGSSSPSAHTTPTQAPASADMHGHKATGPNGFITAPASNPPSSGVPGGSEVFPHIDTKLDKQLYPKLLKMAGVRSVAYYPDFNQLQVYYATDATADERQAVYTYVTSHS